MANPKHLKKLLQDVHAWNQWRKENKAINIDLSDAELEGVDLHGADLSYANLEGSNLEDAVLEDCNFFHTNLHSSILINTKLTNACFVWARLINADLSQADLTLSDLSASNMEDAVLEGAILNKALLEVADMESCVFSNANLDGASLARSNLVNASFNSASLRNTNLQAIKTTDGNSTIDFSEADLTGADLRSAILQEAIFDGANLTNTKLWESQRAGWSIRNVICERAYWDEDAQTPTTYAVGEFERLHSRQTVIELFYENGISHFELNTLPALLHRLSSRHPDLQINLQTIETTGGGTKVTISLGHADEMTRYKIEEDAAQILRAQLALRHDEVRRLQFERDFFRGQFDKINNALLAAAAPQIHFHAPVHTAALPSGNASVEIHQTFNDSTELIRLIDKLLTRKTELTAPQSAEIEAAKAELQKPEPDKSLLTRTLGFLKTLPKEAVLKGAGKLGEKAAETDWTNLLRQLGEFIHHLR